ncbi:MAG TPA: hypothetical protein VMM57_11150 [Bacteroidota bacterium]|nr:hypothetical protein [Bacteroidota bacterium]
MGSSKGVLLSGVALVIGFYMLGIKKSDRLTAEIAEGRANDVQSLNIAQSGIRFAINSLATSNFSITSSESSSSLFGGTLSYTIDGVTLGPGWARITSTGVVGGSRVTLVADVQQTLAGQKKDRGNMWQVAKIYTQPS